MQNVRHRPTKYRRQKWLTMSVIFVTYTIFHAVFSASVDKPADHPIDKTPGDLIEKTLDKSTENAKDIMEKMNAKSTTPLEPDDKDEKGKLGKTPEPSDTQETLEVEEPTPITEEGSKKQEKEIDTEDGEKKREKDAGYVTYMNEYVIPTLRPLRDNCTPPAIEQFPRPIFNQDQRKYGGLVFIIIVAIYTFVGLAIVCDEYFVSSLDRICEELKLAPDVAGATFMAAGSSAPELATVIIGVFFAQDDIGLSGVIGSAVFNIMFVISVCALCAGTVSHLNWWPLCRDCFFYAISILVMLCTIANGYVSWPESVIMLLMYVVYCVALRYNNALEAFVISKIKNLPFKLPTREEQAALVTYKSAPAAKPAATSGDGGYTDMEGQTTETQLHGPGYNTQGAYENAAYNNDPVQSWDSNQSWDPNNDWGEQNQQASQYASGGSLAQQRGTDSWETPNPSQQQVVKSPESDKIQSQAQATVAPVQQAYYKAKEYNPETAIDPLVKPIGANIFQLTYWYAVYPIHFSCRKSMPDCRGRFYPLTFVMSMLWISFYSYFMVWMITIIGYTLGIPDTVMGMTFVAAGVSVPDALSSLAVIKEGYGDMAVSNAVGSNVFDILICLGLPWFLQTAIIYPGSHVNVISKGLVYSTLSLFSTVIFLVVATHANGWKLDRKYGVLLMVWYLLFITFASLYELNVFGYFHPPDCSSLY